MLIPSVAVTAAAAVDVAGDGRALGDKKRRGNEKNGNNSAAAAPRDLEGDTDADMVKRRKAQLTHGYTGGRGRGGENTGKKFLREK